MNSTEARRFLERMVQASVVPLLDSAEVDDLMTIAAQTDQYGYAPETRALWAANTNYAVGAIVVPTVWNGYYFKAVADAGNSGGTEPTWSTVIGQDVIDSGITWNTEGYTWEPTWNLPLAAAEGWDWKAAKVVPQYDVEAGSVNAKRSQVYAMCIKQRDRFRSMSMSGSSVGSIAVTTLEG